MDPRVSKSYYKIREVSELLNIPPTTLRFWESQFPELSPRRSSHNQRFYTAKDIELLQIISYLLYTKGMKIEAVKEQLQHNRSNISKRLDIINKLENVKEDLNTLLEMLSKRLSVLEP